MIVADAIEEISHELGLDPLLIVSIATVESNMNNWPCRFEPLWKYFLDVEAWAQRLGQTFDTERVQQQSSWGAMQVMGSVARELGFQGHLSQLAVPEIGIRYGCLKIKSFLERHGNEIDAIAAYNAGSPRRDSRGKYVNQSYVDKVMANLNKLRGVGNPPPVA